MQTAENNFCLILNTDKNQQCMVSEKKNSQ